MNGKIRMHIWVSQPGGEQMKILNQWSWVLVISLRLHPVLLWLQVMQVLALTGDYVLLVTRVRSGGCNQWLLLQSVWWGGARGVRERARVFETLNFFEKAWCCSIVRVFRQHNSLQLFHECNRCAKQSIEGAPTGGKALPTEALVPSP